jgi:hypothetical protein
MLENLSRQHLGERAYNYPYSVYNRSMIEVHRKGVDVGKVGFASDVYFVRAALEKKFNVLYPLPYVETLMVEMGWCDSSLYRRRRLKTKTKTTKE